MAQNTALALLDNQRQTSAQVYGQIMGAMNSVQQTAQQTAEMTFNVAAKEAEMREQARMNDVRVAQYSFQNEMSAKQHEARMQLLPIEMENERIKLELTRTQSQQALLKNQKDLFDVSVDPFTQMVAARFTEIQDPAYMEGYIGIKGKWQGIVANGGKHDPAAYKAEVDELNRRFENAEPKSGYNPQTSFYLGSLGPSASKQKAVYDNGNPDLKAFNASTTSMLVTGSDEFFQTAMAPGSPASQSYTDSQKEVLARSHALYSQYDQKIEDQRKAVTQAMQLVTYHQTNNNPDGAAMAQQSVISAQSRLTQLEKDQVAIHESAMNFQSYVAPPPPAPPPTALEIKAAKEQANEKVLPAEAPFGTYKANVTNQARTKIAEVFNTLDIKLSGPNEPAKSILSGIDMTDVPVGFQDHEPTKKYIRTTVINNLEGKDSVGMEKLFSAQSGAIKTFFEKGGRLQTTKSYGSRSPSFGSMGSYGYGSSDTGPRSMEFDSYDDINAFVSGLKVTGTEKELLLKDLYADLILNGLIDAYK